MRRLIAVCVVLAFFVAGCESNDRVASSAVVPDVAGASLEEAKARLSEVGLKDDAVDEAQGRSIWRDSNWIVIGQVPSAATEVEAGTAVRLSVRHVDDPTEVDAVALPDLVGTNLAEAQDRLREMALRDASYDAREGRGVWVAENWTVVEQQPEAGVSVLPGDTISLGVERHGASADPEASGAPWDGPKDGTWEYGDVGYGDTWSGREYHVTVVGLPEFGPLVDDEVTVTGEFEVTRHADLGYYETVLDDLRFGFTPGNRHWERHHEGYGIDVQSHCDPEELNMGEVGTCTVSFRAPIDEMQDFRWWISGRSVAAWPGQTSS